MLAPSRSGPNLATTEQPVPFQAFYAAEDALSSAHREAGARVVANMSLADVNFVVDKAASR